MSDYGYPELEHRETPTSSAQILRQEVALYEPGEDLRDGIIGIGHLYAKSPFMKYAEKSAFLASLVSVSPDGAIQERGAGVNMPFFVGEVLAIHSLLQPLPKNIRQGFLKSDFLDTVSNPEVPEKLRKADLAAATEKLSLFLSATWLDRYCSHDPDYQELLSQIAEKSFCDMEDSGQEYSLVAGYMWVEGSVVSALETYGARHFTLSQYQDY